ncbi:MAG: AMIN domain-containing protein [Deltaproteobacteria bacterium]|nr:AMIN domain-containing protein [Deltaproteobacteria bacterium]
MLRYCTLSLFAFVQVLTALCSQEASALPLPVKVEDGVSTIEITENPLTNELSVTVTSPKITGSASFVVENPTRIVGDIEGMKSTRNRTIKIDSGSLASARIRAVRVGAHDDKSRVVVDVIGSAIPRFTWSQSEGTATLKVSLSETQASVPALLTPSAPDTTSAAPTESPAVISAKRTPTSPPATPTSRIEEAVDDMPVIEELIPKVPNPTPTHTTAPTFTATPAPSPTSVKTPTAANTPTATSGSPDIPVSPAAMAVATLNSAKLSGKVAPKGQQEVVALEFGYSGRTVLQPTIKIRLAKKTRFGLQKLDDRMYRLVIPDCRLLRPPLKLPQFPPQDFLGFNMVLMEETSEGVEAKIAVERNARITAAPAGDSIWITLAGKASPITKSAPNPRAQRPSARR